VVKYLKASALLIVFVSTWFHSVGAQDAIYEFKWPSQISKLDPSLPTLIEVPATESSKFYFPYYLYVPRGVRQKELVRLLVEPNNTGTAVDNFEVHRQAAKELASQGNVRLLADKLRTPLLVPVFPRPTTVYTQSLNRPALLAKDDHLSRIDLQLLSMIQHARELLRSLGVLTKPKIFMDGFSASACFVNRFAALHPEVVRALTAGGINGLPIFPLEIYQGNKLPYPIGVADLKELTGAPFDAESYKRVSQYVYMGSLDRNDTFPFSDSWDDDERTLIAKLFGREMIPSRWQHSQEIISNLQLPIQTVTYCCIGHDPGPVLDDVVAFLKANEGDEPKTIAPHQAAVQR
jgi:hypothetical protein